MLVGGLGSGPAGDRLEIIGWLSAFLVLIGLNISTAASAVTFYHHCAALGVINDHE